MHSALLDRRDPATVLSDAQLVLQVIALCLVVAFLLIGWRLLYRNVQVLGENGLFLVNLLVKEGCGANESRQL